MKVGNALDAQYGDAYKRNAGNASAIDALGGVYPEIETDVLHPADVAFFLGLCRTPGKPVNFVPVIDKDVRRSLGGTYTISSSGGPQVGSFTKSATIPSSFNVTNWDSITALSRSSPLTINWTGSGFDQLIITIGSLVTSGSTSTSATVTCPLPASLGTYTVPAAAMGMLLATNNGSLAVTARPDHGGALNAVSTTSQSFTPSLVGGGTINYGDFSPFLSAVKLLPIQ